MRKLSEIAKEIRADWKNVSVYARPYLDAMASLSTCNENYHADTARGVVLYFLSNAGSWRGEVARRVKKELKEMVK